MRLSTLPLLSLGLLFATTNAASLRRTQRDERKLMFSYYDVCLVCDPGTALAIPTDIIETDSGATITCSLAQMGGMMALLAPAVCSTARQECECESLEGRSWLGLVGEDGESAKTTIEHDVPGVHVYVIPQDSPVTMDYRLDRVRIFVNDNGEVSSAPTIG